VPFAGTDDLILHAGADTEGMVVTQAVPPCYLTELKTVAMYRKTLAKYFPGEQPGLVNLEGFVDAMVMVEGLKRAGKDLTRDGLIRATESIHQMDLGLRPQLKLDYSSHDHAGLKAVIPTVVRGGHAVPLTDWAMLK
jgi:branched-chain amino acid transport system substrate-binding protein